jgi:heme exporter protein A
VIILRDLEVRYGRTIALRPMSLRLFEGVTGLFGPNGAGKSTLLRVLAGLLRPSAGQAVLDGRPMRASDPAFRRLVGYAGHSSGLYSRLTVRENLELFATLHDAPRKRVDAVIEELGLTARATTPAGELSAGLRRRAAVARALLLLDEPYANLDDEACELVSAAVVRWRAPGRTAVIATHGAKRVKRFADASVILQRGEVVSYRRRVTAAEATRA